MVKAIIKHDAGTDLILGVTRGNVDRMVAGKPIRVDLREMEVTADGNILIFFGETEQDLKDQLAEFIGPETKVTVDPRLGKL
jgi:hypothetical protein